MLRQDPVYRVSELLPIQFVVNNELNWGYTQSMRYLPAQAKEALEITEETFRHWRNALPPLKGKRGYAPCFSPGDLLALKVVSKLHAFGIQVRYLTPHAENLFKVCQGAWFSLEDKTLLFDGQELELVGQEAIAWVRQPRIAIPLQPLIHELRRSLSEEHSRPLQPEIPFPPLGVAQGRAP